MNNQLTIDELRAYQAGQLDGPARHRVERLLLEDPFYADALEGLEALQHVGASLPKQTAKLRLALHDRIHESATERRLFPLWVTSLAASIVLVLGVAFYVIYTNDPAKKPLAQQTKASVTEPIEIDMVSQHPVNVKRAVEAVAVIQQTVHQEAKEPEKVTQSVVMTPHEQGRGERVESVATSSVSPEETPPAEAPVLEEPVANLRQILHPERAFGPNAPDALEVLAANVPVVVSAFTPSARKVSMSYAMPGANVPQAETITGLITDSQGVPLPGVMVTVKGTNRGTSTDGAGRFSLDAKETDSRNLIASFIGYKTVEFPATTLAKGAVQLQEDTQALAEVVVGYGRITPQKELRFKGLRATDFLAKLPQDDSYLTNLSPADGDAYKAYVKQNANPQLTGPISVRIRTNADGSVRRVNVEDGILTKELDGKWHRKHFPSPETRTEAERLVRQYPNWPKKRQQLHWIWIVGWKQNTD